MKRLDKIFLFAVSLLLWSVLLHAAGSRDLLFHQGLLFKADGTPVNGALNITFRLYDSSSATVPLWEEKETVSLENSVFTAALGSVTPIPSNLFESQETLFLGVQVEGDSEMSPRQELFSVPWAERAEVAMTAKSLANGIVTSDSIAPNTITSAKISDGTIANVDVSATAAIVYSKLNLSNSIVAGDLTTGSVTSAKILDGTIAAADLADNAVDVSSAKVTGTLAAGRFPALTGDVTTTAGSLATTIANSAVTTAKINNNAVDGTKIALGSDAQGDIMYFDGTDYARLAVGTSGQFLKTNGASANPAWASVPGTFIGTQVLTSGILYTPTSGTNKVTLVLVGGGGGGGGVKGTIGSTGAAGGGGAGGTLIVTFGSVSGTYTYAIGALGGGGGGVTPNNGTAGDNTTFTNGVTTYTAYGGSGGGASTAGTVVANVAGGAGGVVSTNGDVNGGGAPGANGITLSGSVGNSGAGGSTPYGGGSVGLTSGSNSANATGFGAGGGGAMSTTSANKIGGNGSAGVIIVYEYR